MTDPTKRDGVIKLEGASERMRDAGNGFPKRRGRPRKATTSQPVITLAMQTSAPAPTPPSMRVPDNGVAETWLPPRLLDVKAAPKHLGGVSPWTIRDLAAAGRLPRVRQPLGGDKECRRLLFDKADLDRLVAASKETR